MLRLYTRVYGNCHLIDSYFCVSKYMAKNRVFVDISFCVLLIFFVVCWIRFPFYYQFNCFCILSIYFLTEVVDKRKPNQRPKLVHWVDVGLAEPPLVCSNRSSCRHNHRQRNDATCKSIDLRQTSWTCKYEKSKFCQRISMSWEYIYQSIFLNIK